MMVRNVVTHSIHNLLLIPPSLCSAHLQLDLQSARALNDLRAEFDDAGDGLEMEQFVEVMLRKLPKQQDEGRRSVSTQTVVVVPLRLISRLSVALTAQLSELFAQIDVNGDGTLEWDEWTSFCVEAGIVATRQITAPVRIKVRRALFFSKRLLV